MAEVVLKLTDISKTYILGKRKNAKKAQKAIQKMQKRFEAESAKGQHAKLIKTEKVLKIAQTQFSDEQYEASYHSASGKRLKKRPNDRGAVVHALRGVDLEVKEGDLLAIMGPSGSGKSTLLNILGILDQPSSGQIHLNKENVATIKKRELPIIRSKELGFVFQSYNLIPTMTALENVMLPLRYSGMPTGKRKSVATAALERVGLGDRISHTPNELSGGQKQRVAIARSIVNNPSIIFGDELTGELDSKMTKDVMKIIENLNKKGQTFIIVTHNPEVSKFCRRIIHMKDGRIRRETRN